MLHLGIVATIAVRVNPRSVRTAVEVSLEGVVVRVRAVPEGGRATAEAAAALAAALRVPRTHVRLRTGARARTKVFDVTGISTAELERRLGDLRDGA